MKTLHSHDVLLLFVAVSVFFVFVCVLSRFITIFIFCAIPFMHFILSSYGYFYSFFHFSSSRSAATAAAIIPGTAAAVIRILVSSQMPFVLSFEQAKRACVSAFSHACSLYFYSFLSAKCSIVCHTFVVSANCDFSVETCAHLYLPKQRRDGKEPYNHRALFCAHVFFVLFFSSTKQSKVTLGIHLFENNKRALPHLDSHKHTHTHVPKGTFKGKVTKLKEYVFNGKKMLTLFLR